MSTKLLGLWRTKTVDDESGKRLNSPGIHGRLSARQRLPTLRCATSPVPDIFSLGLHRRRRPHGPLTFCMCLFCAGNTCRRRRARCSPGSAIDIRASSPSTVVGLGDSTYPPVASGQERTASPRVPTQRKFFPVLSWAPDTCCGCATGPLYAREGPRNKIKKREKKNTVHQDGHTI